MSRQDLRTVAFVGLLLISVIGFLWQTHQIMGFNPLRVEWWIWLFKYYWQVRSHPPELVSAAMTAATYWAPVAIGGFVVVLLIPLTPKADYGKARFAKSRDLKKMGLQGKEGIVLGQSAGRLLAIDAWLSSMCFAAPGAGKTAGHIIPSVLYSGAGRSIAVHDLAGEIWDETGGHRSRLGPCARVEWAKPESARWNPLNPRELPDDHADLQTYIDGLWMILLPKKSGDNAIFDDQGRRLGAAVTLYHVLSAAAEDRDASFADILHWITEGSASPAYADSEDPIGAFLVEHAVISEHNGWPRTIASIFRAIATTGFKERSSYLNSMRNGLEIWENEHVARATSKSDFVVANLRGVNDKPFSLYICVPEKDIEVFSGITRMLLTNICNFANSQPKDVAAKGKGITFFIDEAPRLGYMPKVVLDGPALGRKVRMNFCCIAQDPGQVRAVYGNDGWETIKTVYQFKIVYHQINTSTQKELADMIGFETRTRQSRTIRKGLKKGPVKGSESEEGAYLVRPEEFGNLAQYHSLVFAPHYYSSPVRSEGAYAPKRREFKRKYGLAPPAPRPSV